MIKRIVGILAAIASLAVIVLAALHYGSYSSMIGDGAATRSKNERVRTLSEPSVPGPSTPQDTLRQVRQQQGEA